MKARQSAKPDLDLPLVDKWQGIEASLQGIASEQSSTVRVGGLSKLSNLQVVGSEKKNDVRRNLIASQLLSPAEKAYRTPTSQAKTSVVLFSPPSTSKHRSAWDRVSTVDQNRAKEMAMPLPRDLKEVTVSAASRHTLAAVGTTPEKVQASLDIKKSEGATRTPPRQQKLSSSLSTSTEGFQMRKMSDPKKASVAAFPPLPTKAPTPFSQQKSQPVQEASSSKSGDKSSYPPLSSVAPKPFSTQSDKIATDKFASKKLEPAKAESKTAAEPLTEKKEVVSSFGDMKGLGSALFSASTSAPSTESSLFSSSKPPNATATTSNQPHDYKALLTSFYQKHNPAKVAEVDKALDRYKVSRNLCTGSVVCNF
jgi:hypothetical protein